MDDKSEANFPHESEVDRIEKLLALLRELRSENKEGELAQADHMEAGAHPLS
jgi:hypothetical protein